MSGSADATSRGRSLDDAAGPRDQHRARHRGAASV